MYDSNATQTFEEGEWVVLTKVKIPAIGSVVAVTETGYEVAFYSGVASVKSDEIRKYGSRSSDHPQDPATAPLLLTSAMQNSA